MGPSGSQPFILEKVGLRLNLRMQHLAQSRGTCTDVHSRCPGVESSCAAAVVFLCFAACAASGEKWNRCPGVESSCAALEFVLCLSVLWPVQLQVRSGICPFLLYFITSRAIVSCLD